MTNEFLKDEVLSAEQLDMVVGGNYLETFMDAAFFQRVGYNVAGTDKIKNAYSANGVKVFLDNSIKNSYDLKVDGEWTSHPQWAVMGYVLAKRNYPGFNGKWTDSRYVHSFLKENFNITDATHVSMHWSRGTSLCARRTCYLNSGEHEVLHLQHSLHAWLNV